MLLPLTRNALRTVRQYWYLPQSMSGRPWSMVSGGCGMCIWMWRMMSGRCALCLWGGCELWGEIGVWRGWVGLGVVSFCILWNKSECFTLAGYWTNEISTRRFIWMMMQMVGNGYGLWNMLNVNLAIGLTDKMQNSDAVTPRIKKNIITIVTKMNRNSKMQQAKTWRYYGIFCWLLYNNS